MYELITFWKIKILTKNIFISVCRIQIKVNSRQRLLNLTWIDVSTLACLKSLNNGAVVWMHTKRPHSVQNRVRFFEFEQIMHPTWNGKFHIRWTNFINEWTKAKIILPSNHLHFICNICIGYLSNFVSKQVRSFAS